MPLVSGGATKWNRSRQVCTECRQQKLKCDAQATFPLPCSRCSTIKPSPPICRIDPSFKRARRRDIRDFDDAPATRATGSALVTSGGDLSSQEDIQSTSASPPVVLAPLISASGKDNLVEAGEPEPLCLWESFAGTSVQIAYTQAKLLFDKFFSEYHPHCPIFLRPRDPSPLYHQCPLLFWTILLVASRSYGSVDSDASTSVPYSSIANEVKTLVAQLSYQPPRTVASIQALVLLCEWPSPTKRLRDDRTWYYSGLTIQYGLQLGLHRPFHSHEFSSRPAQQQAAESYRGREQTLCWLYCHIINYNIAADLGLPSIAKEDYVVAEAASASIHDTLPRWLEGIPRNVLDALRLALFDERVNITLGHSPLSNSGQAGKEASAALGKTMFAELGRIERELGLGDPKMNARIHISRSRLCALVLQSEPPKTGVATNQQAVLESFTSCVRLIELLQSTGLESVRAWPRSVTGAIAVVCASLIQLLLSHKNHGIEWFSVLARVTAAYHFYRGLIFAEGDAFDRFTQLLAFSARDAQLRKVNDIPENTRWKHTSRLGIVNWKYDLIARAKNVRGYHEDIYGNEGQQAASAMGEPVTAREPAEGSNQDMLFATTDMMLEDPSSFFSRSEFDNFLANPILGGTEDWDAFWHPPDLQL